MNAISKPRLRRAEVPAYLAEKFGVTVAVRTLAKIACIGGGPRITYFGRTPLYAVSDLDEWALERLSKPVASTSARGR